MELWYNARELKASILHILKVTGNFGKKDTKEKLTKAQKRRFFDKFGAAAEKPRGWDWVSIISHVSAIFSSSFFGVQIIKREHKVIM